MNVERAFTADRVLRLTGLSRRQLQYWEDTGLVRPSLSRAKLRGHGRPRLYDFRDLVELRTAARLRDLGISLQLIRKVRHHLRRLDYAKLLAELAFEVVDHQLFFVEAGTVRKGRQPEQLVMHVTVPLPAIVAALRAQIAELDERATGAITQRRGLLGGKPVISGTRIPVATIHRLAEDGLSIEEMIDLYPDLTEEDVAAALSSPSSTSAPRRRAPAAG